MTKNIGSADGIIRMILTIMIGLLYFTGTLKGNYGILIGSLAIILAFSSFFRFYPLYYPFGISTYHSKN